MTVLRTISCDAKCTATSGPHPGTEEEVREAASAVGWSYQGTFDACPAHTCRYTHAHTRHWCGYPFCRES